MSLRSAVRPSAMFSSIKSNAFLAQFDRTALNGARFFSNGFFVDYTVSMIFSCRKISCEKSLVQTPNTDAELLGRLFFQT